jgi:hypothetical protein
MVHVTDSVRKAAGRQEMRPVSTLSAAAFAGMLAACSQTATPPPADSPRTSASLVTPAGFRLPEGTGCAGELARFRAVQANDLQTGHVNRTVHERIAGELSAAEAQCSAGNDGGARAALAATKRRYGYPG